MKEVTQGFRTVSGLTRIPELTEAERQSFAQGPNCWAVPKRRECSTTRKEFGFCRVFLGGSVAGEHGGKRNPCRQRGLLLFTGVGRLALREAEDWSNCSTETRGQQTSEKCRMLFPLP